MDPRLKVPTKGPRETEDFIGLLSALKTIEMLFKSPDRATEVCSLQEWPQLQEESMAIVKTSIRV